MSKQGADAAFPQSVTPIPGGATVACGYIGGDALHVWDTNDWNHWGVSLRVPIWVRSNPGSVDATADANACVAALKALGAPAPYLVLPYGSTGNLFQNPPADGYWPATLNGINQFYPHAGVVATQWFNNPNYDLSIIGDGLPLWNTATGTGPTSVMLDLETAIDVAYVNTFTSILHSVAGPAQKEDDMLLIAGFPNNAIYLLSGGKLSHVVDTQSEQAIQGGGVPLITVSSAEATQLLADFPGGNPAVTVTPNGTFSGTLSGSIS